MKHILYTLFLSIIFLTARAQTASVLLSTQSTPKDTSVRNFVFIGAGNRIFVAKVDSLKMYPYNMTWLKDSTLNWSDVRYPQIAVPYSNPNFVNSLSAAKVFGLSSVATTGDYNDLTSKPNLSLFYLNSNPNGYISGVTSGDVISALGYTPYPSSNPNNYQTKTVQAANGLIKSSSFSADTIEADWNLIMSVQRANDSIASVKTSINGKLNISDTTNKWLGIGYSPSNSQIISALGGTPLFSEVDGSTTNELQTLSIVNRIITLSNAGGTVTIPYQSFDSLTNKPTTLLGYGITDGVTNSSLSSTLSGYATTSSLNSKMNYSDTISLSNRVNTKQNQLNGTGFVKANGTIITYDNSTYLTSITSGQVTTALGYTPLRGSDTTSLSNRINTKLNSSDTTSLSTRINTKVDQAGARAVISLTTTGTGAAAYNNTTGVLNIPTPSTSKRQLTFSGVTSGSGTYTGTFSPAFSVAPNIQANITGGTPNQFLTMTVTTSGFTVTAYQRNTVSLLGFEVLLGATTALNGANIDVLITEK